MAGSGALLLSQDHKEKYPVIYPGLSVHKQAASSSIVPTRPRVGDWRLFEAHPRVNLKATQLGGLFLFGSPDGHDHMVRGSDEGRA